MSIDILILKYLANFDIRKQSICLLVYLVKLVRIEDSPT